MAILTLWWVYPRPLTSYLLFMDVSDEGYEGFILRKISSAKFEKYEKDTSSTFTELIAVKYVLTSFDSILKNQSVQVNLDKSSAC